MYELSVLAHTRACDYNLFTHMEMFAHVRAASIDHLSLRLSFFLSLSFSLSLSRSLGEGERERGREGEGEGEGEGERERERVWMRSQRQQYFASALLPALGARSPGCGGAPVVGSRGACPSLLFRPPLFLAQVMLLA